MKIEQLLNVLEQLDKSRTFAATVKEKAISAGYTSADIMQFINIGESMRALVETLATAVGLAELREHVPSARYALQSMEYISNASNWLYTFMNKSGINPGDFGWRDNNDLLAKKIAQFKPKMEAIIQDYESREAFAKEVNAHD